MKVSAIRVDPVLCVLLTVYIASSLFMLTKFPKVWMDTAWTTVEAYSMVTEGRLANPMLPVNGFDEHLLAPQIVQRLLLAGTYKMIGFGLWQSRIVSVLAGFLLLVATYWFTSRYFDRRVARLATALLMIDNLFFVASRTVRADIFVAVFAVSGFFLFLHGIHVGSRIAVISAGLLVGLSFYTHPNGFLVFVALLFVYGFLEKGRIFSWQFSNFVIAVFISVLPYLVYLFVVDYSNGFSTFFAQLGGNASYLERNYLEDYFSELQRYDNYIFFPKRLLIFLVQLFAVLFVFLRLDGMARKVATLPVVYAVLLPLWAPQNSTARYFIVIIPSISILVAYLFLRGWAARKSIVGEHRRKAVEVSLISILIFYSVNQIAGNAYILWDHRNNDYFHFIGEIRGVIPKESRVWGSISFWIGLYENPYRSQITPFDEVMRFKPEYVILYDHDIWGDRSATLGRRIERNNVYDEIKSRMVRLCSQQGQFLKSIDDRYYGNVKIYKIDWSIRPDHATERDP